jgi:putative MATE family efflux protein
MLKQMNARVDLTEGSILKKLIIFSIPMFLGNLFQQFYNLSDALIVGKFADNNAFAAISSTGSFIFLLVGFFMGIAMGASVVISKFVGAKDPENTKKAIHTVFAFGIVASILATVIGVVLTPYILTWMDTPKSVYPDSFAYLTIYFGGVSTIIMYNVCMGIMRATGDSAYPLYYLIISSIINVLLDLLFVAVFSMGVAGAAIATIISQGISCVLCIIRMCRMDDETRLVFKEIKFHKGMLRDTIMIGLPTGLQNSIISIGNIVIQTNINSFGPNAMSGQGAYAKIEGFGFIPITCMSMALTTFISQNLGAKQYKRAKRGALIGTLLAVGMAQVIGLTIMFLAEPLLRLFIDDADSISYGLIHANIASMFFFLLAFSHCASGILRGCGKAMIPMFTMLSFWCVLRVIYVTVTIQYIPKFQTISWAYPLTWSLSSLVFIIILLFTDWVHGLEKKTVKTLKTV